MDALEELIRLSEDAEELRRYLGRHDVSLANPEDWDEELFCVSRIVEIADNLPPKQLEGLIAEAGRIAHMAKPGPHHGLAVLFYDDPDFHKIGGQFDRSRWAFEKHPERFAAAEAYYDFSEFYGMPSRCQTYEGVPGLSKADLTAYDGEFVRNLQTMLKLSKNFCLRVHDQVGRGNGIQMTLYLEDLPVDELTLRKGALGSLKRWPVYCYVIFYHPESGRYDVVAKTKRERKFLSEAVSHCLMRNGPPREVANHGFDLQTLLVERTFSLGDGMCSVEVLSLKVLNHDDKTVYQLTPSEEGACLYENMGFKGEHSPLVGSADVLEAKFRVCFSRTGPWSRDKQLTFRVTTETAYLSHKLDEPEARIILYKYLRLWKLERLSPATPLGALL